MRGCCRTPNPGIMTAADLTLLIRPLNVSLGLMLESTSATLRRKGHATTTRPTRDPDLRLQVLRDAGEQRIPFTTGILIGIGDRTPIASTACSR